MSERFDGEETKGAAKRFHVELFIVHPTIDPAAIAAGLGLEPVNVQHVGHARQTPKGTPLPGVHRDTRWRHSVECTTTDRHFVEAVRAFLEKLKPHRDVLSNVRATGGETELIVQFLDVGYFGDSIDAETLATMQNLGLSLGLEIYGVTQS